MPGFKETSCEDHRDAPERQNQTCKGDDQSLRYINLDVNRLEWLKDEYVMQPCAEPVNHVLIQGDCGACYILVQVSFRLKLIPIYSTTQRKAVEENGPEGAVRLTHEFKHVLFSKYER